MYNKHKEVVRWRKHQAHLKRIIEKMRNGRDVFALGSFFMP